MKRGVQRKKKKAKKKIYKSVTSDKYHINNMFITKKKYNIVVVVGRLATTMETYIRHIFLSIQKCYIVPYFHY